MIDHSTTDVIVSIGLAVVALCMLVAGSAGAYFGVIGLVDSVKAARRTMRRRRLANAIRTHLRATGMSHLDLSGLALELAGEDPGGAINRLPDERARKAERLLEDLIHAAERLPAYLTPFSASGTFNDDGNVSEKVVTCRELYVLTHAGRDWVEG